MAGGRRRRLDAELVRRGLARSRTQAQRLIGAGRVTVEGTPADKPASMVAPQEAIVVLAHGRDWVSRGGHKLASALEAFDVAVAARHCLDAGASTGGFTDVLLHAGAARVVAVDVGYGQLAWRLRTDPRVVVLDRTNVRHLTAADVPPPQPELVVADLSFISLTLVVPALRRVAAADADHLLLVKPQFEAGRDRVGGGGVVRDPAVWAEVMTKVAETAARNGLGLVGATPSALRGPAGNVEFFLRLRAGGGADVEATVNEAAVAGQRLGNDDGVQGR